MNTHDPKCPLCRGTGNKSQIGLMMQCGCSPAGEPTKAELIETILTAAGPDVDADDDRTFDSVWNATHCGGDGFEDVAMNACRHLVTHGDHDLDELEGATIVEDSDLDYDGGTIAACRRLVARW